jgi:hypothetical protein
MMYSVIIGGLDFDVACAIQKQLQAAVKYPVLVVQEK